MSSSGLQSVRRLMGCRGEQRASFLKARVARGCGVLYLDL